jgi:Aldose 1-epimerase
MMALPPPVVAGDPTVILSSPTGSVSLHLLPSYGLTFHKLVVNDYDVLIGPESTEGYLSEGRNFRNQVIGRYANRLPSGRWQVDGVTVDLIGDRKDPPPKQKFHRIRADRRIFTLLLFLPLLRKSRLLAWWPDRI